MFRTKLTLAVLALGTSTAAAEPEFLTKAVVGEAAPATVPFTGTVGTVVFEAVDGARITCVASPAVAGTRRAETRKPPGFDNPLRRNTRPSAPIRRQIA